MVKVCSKCGVEKPDTEFKKDGKSKDGLYFRCKECDREYRREYYAKNREHIRKRYNDRYKNDPEYRKRTNQFNSMGYRKHKTKRQTRYKEYCGELQEFIDSLKTQCVKCGESRKWLLQFHHIIPNDKKFQIQAQHSREKLEEESKKCVCLCSNCHIEYHFFFGKRPIEPKKTLDHYLSEDFTYESVES